jgi:hypothetical protein
VPPLQCGRLWIVIPTDYDTKAVVDPRCPYHNNVISELGFADERPRNVTLIVERTEMSHNADGTTDTSKPFLEIYYAANETAYVPFGSQIHGENTGVVLAPNVTSGSHTFDDVVPSLGRLRVTNTVSIYGQMSNLKIWADVQFEHYDVKQHLRSAWASVVLSVYTHVHGANLRKGLHGCWRNSQNKI